MLLALLTTLRHLRDGMPFNIGWWGFTFPIGVYSLATLALARLLHMQFMFVFGSSLIVGLAALWVVVGSRTLHGAWNGYLFVSPCLVPGSIPEDRVTKQP
jgi:tellurite resistance protein TehA-like permease